MTQPKCGAVQPSGIPDPFDWWPFVVLPIVGGIAAGVYAGGVPILNGVLMSLTGLASMAASLPLTSAVAGAAGILTLFMFFALKPDGCIRPTPKGQAVCFSGIVEDTADLSDAAIAVLAPFAMGPSALFNVVLKSTYWFLAEKNAFWVYCSQAGSPMLPCVVRSSTACGAKVGSLIGGVAGGVAGIVLGFLAGTLLGCAVTGPFYLFCMLLALIVAAVIAAVTTYVAGMVGGWIGQAFAAAASDPVGDAWDGLSPGAIVTVKGNWVTNSDIGNNELFYTTGIHRTGKFPKKPPYTAAQADDTAADDCPVAPKPPS
jgi:hypothetical protein